MDNARFLSLLVGDEGLSEDEKVILCSVRDDPNVAPPQAWRPIGWPGCRPLNVDWNNYATISTFGRADDGTFRRRDALWRSGRALMVDDIGTKVNVDVLKKLTPTVVVETSEGNFQAWFMLLRPERDKAKFDQLIRAFIDQQLLGADPGMSSVTRVGRLPGGRNLKAGKEWDCRVSAVDAQARYTTDEIVRGFGLKLLGKIRTKPRLLAANQRELLEEWRGYYFWLRGRGMLKRAVPDASGWIEMECPWRADHTNAANTGAAIREPAEDNGYVGAFRCHHGHCDGKNWRHLTTWISEHAEESNATTNAAGVWDE